MPKKTIRSAALPSGRVLDFDFRGEPARVAPTEGEPLYAEVDEVLADGRVSVTERGARVRVDDLSLADFHALRALLTACGALDEEPIDIKCRNCDREISVRPCDKMPTAPFEDAELDDAELDRTLDLSLSHDVAGGRSVKLASRTVLEARPLHEAIARGPLHVSARIAQAMGVVEVDGERDPAKIARTLREMSDAEWGEVTDLFLAAHYPRRLAAIVVCPSCGARNDVDAPYDREFEPSGASARDHERFVEFAAFDDKARALAEEIFAAAGIDLEDQEKDRQMRERIVLVVEAGTPACDDGGEPLLGSYVPAFAGDNAVPARPAEISVFYRTFRAMWEEDGAYDWEAELHETIEHELEHHFSFLRGDDPVDDAERQEIADEAQRVLGRREIARQGVRDLGADFGGFLKRTWPLWLLLVVVVALVTLWGER